MTELGRELHQVRQMKGLSLNSAANTADISPAYLQKLEAGLVKAPSPPVLQRVAKALELPYSKVMETAGYLTPQNSSKRTSPNLLAHALLGADLTEQEAAALAEYLAFLRQRRAPAG